METYCEIGVKKSTQILVESLKKVKTWEIQAYAIWQK